MTEQSTSPADPTATTPAWPAPATTAADPTPAPPADPAATVDPRDAQVEQLRAELAAQAAVDPRDAEIAALRAELAQATRTTTTGPATVAVTPAEASSSYVPKVGDICDYEATDPQTGRLLFGVGQVVEVTGSHAIVARLDVLNLPVTVLNGRHGT